MEFHSKLKCGKNGIKYYDFPEYFFIQISAVNLHSPFHSFEKIVTAAESQSTHLWNNFEVSIDHDIIRTCLAHVAAYSHVTSTSGKTFQDCKKALVYSDFAKTLHLNGFSLKCRA